MNSASKAEMRSLEPAPFVPVSLSISGAHPRRRARSPRHRGKSQVNRATASFPAFPCGTIRPRSRSKPADLIHQGGPFADKSISKHDGGIACPADAQSSAPRSASSARVAASAILRRRGRRSSELSHRGEHTPATSGGRRALCGERSAEWWAPQHASIATMQAGSLSRIGDHEFSRRIRRRTTTLPDPSSPTRLQLFLPRSIPRTAICIAPLLSHQAENTRRLG